MTFVSAMRCENCRTEHPVDRDRVPDRWYRITGNGHRWDLCSPVCVADFFDPLGPRRKERWGTGTPPVGGGDDAEA